MDNASIALIQTAHPTEQANMLAAYNACVANTPANVHPSVVQVYRSIAESDRLYQLGRDADGNVIDESEVVSDAKGGQSWHNYGLAIDIEMIRDGQGVDFDNTPAAAALAAADPDYAVIINTMATFGYTWGGNFPGNFRDVPHFENKRGQLLSDLYAKYEAGDLIAGTSYVNF
jgi:peptidoglycan L-alanyl-D-glutamate endopeptidase CwlK